MRILVLMGSYFPYGVAISSRIMHFCKLFNYCGADVHVISLYSKDAACQIGETYCLDCCTYEIATKKKESSFESFFGYKDFMICIKQYLERYGKPDAVFLSGVESYYSRICRMFHGTPMYLEQCEWMDKSSYRFRSMDYRYIRRNRLIRNGYKKVSAVFSISRLLDEYYASIGMESIRIPTILDVKNMRFSCNTDNEKIVIVYTGNPSTSKELFRPVFEALRENSLFRDKFEFHIYGPDKERVIANIDNDEELYRMVKDNVFIHGKVPQEKIGEILRNADYQMFIRPLRRSSNAGFPTKLAESMAVGTPVITNLTGDIGLYLEDGANGFLANGVSSSSIKDVFEKILRTDDKKYSEMRKEARRTAEKCFDFRCYCDEIKTILGLEKEHEV